MLIKLLKKWKIFANNKSKKHYDICVYDNIIALYKQIINNILLYTIFK